MCQCGTSPSCLCQNIYISFICYKICSCINCLHTLKCNLLIFFCDGSVDGSKSGWVLFIRDYVFPDQYTGTEVSRRLPGNLSSTKAVLYGILEALHIVTTFVKNVFLFVDSQAALRSLISPAPTSYDIVKKCLSDISNIEERVPVSTSHGCPHM